MLQELPSSFDARTLAVTATNVSEGAHGLRSETGSSSAVRLFSSRFFLLLPPCLGFKTGPTLFFSVFKRYCTKLNKSRTSAQTSSSVQR